jgi:hypothetical protein
VSLAAGRVVDDAKPMAAIALPPPSHCLLGGRQQGRFAGRPTGPGCAGEKPGRISVVGRPDDEVFIKSKAGILKAAILGTDGSAKVPAAV